jgi:hypothetical protein
MSKRTDYAARALIVMAACSLAQPGPTIAAEKESGSADNAYLAALKACQSEADAAVRLACFDKAAATILAASEQGNLRMVDREEVRRTRRSLFGFSLPDFGLFGGRDDDQPREEKIEQLETTIAKVRASDNGGWIIVTAEGAVWRVDNVPARLLSPKVGQPLEIRSGALTSYFLRINGQPGVRGYRVG